MDDCEVEEVAKALRRFAGYGPCERILAFDIAERLLGRGNVGYGDPSLPARLVGQAIYVPLGSPDLNFTVACLLGEWALRTLVEDGEISRENAAAVGAATLAPALAVPRARKRYGEDLPTLAQAFGLPLEVLIQRLSTLRERGHRIPGPVRARIVGIRDTHRSPSRFVERVHAMP